MAYTIKETGALGNVNKLMDSLHNFIKINTNFTIVDFSIYRTGKRLVIKKGATYYQMYSGVKESPGSNSARTYDNITIFMSKSFDPSNDFNDENRATEMRNYKIMTFKNDIPFYGLYWNGENIVVVAEYENGFYSFMNLGTQKSFGTYSVEVATASLLSDSSNIDSYYRPLFEQFQMKADDLWFGGRANNTAKASSASGTPGFGSNNDLVSGLYNELNGKSALLYEMFYFQKDSIYYPMGENADMAYASAEYLNPQEEFFVGSKKFVFFPFWQKETPTNYTNNKNRGMGIALRLT